MATESTGPLDLYRANLGLVPRTLNVWHEARQQVCEFEMLRVKRDLAALSAKREAAGARDWSELASSYQTTLREYLAATTNLWQQGLVSAVKQQSVCSDGMRDAFARWQAAWTGQWQKAAGMTSTMMPLQEWMQRFDQTVRGAPDGRAAFGPDMNSAAPPAAARSRAAQGDRHVG
jgi:hypothetical protein